MTQKKIKMSKTFSQTLGKILKDHRRRMGLNSKVVAKELGVSVQQIYKYETGTNSLRVEALYIFCNLLHLDFSNFIKSFHKIIKRKIDRNDLIFKN